MEMHFRELFLCAIEDHIITVVARAVRELKFENSVWADIKSNRPRENGARAMVFGTMRVP
jgi:hypothetical protein